MTVKKDKTAPAGTEAEVKNTTHAIESSIGTYAPSDIKDVPVIASDVFSHLPAFYRAALTVMARNGRCTIQEA